MKKIGLLFALVATVIIGCKNEEKKEMKEVTSEETMDTMVSEVVDGHNSQNSLDWAGIYEGTTPCADCEGIKTILELNEDNTYVLSQTYLGKPEIDNEFKRNGSFTWNGLGSIVTLKDGDAEFEYKVGENQLWILDANGDIIDGDLADMFILKKKVLR